MIIDVTPTLEEAKGIDADLIEMRGIPCLYVVRTIDGADHTVKFDAKRLDEFIPTTKLSDMLEEWQEGLHRLHNMYMNAYYTSVHPHWKNHIDEIHPLTGKPTGKRIAVDYIIDAESREMFLAKANEIKPKLGKLTFIQICK